MSCSFNVSEPLVFRVNMYDSDSSGIVVALFRIPEPFKLSLNVVTATASVCPVILNHALLTFTMFSANCILKILFILVSPEGSVLFVKFIKNVLVFN